MDFVIKHEVLCEYMWNDSGKSRNKIDIIVNKIKSEQNFVSRKNELFFDGAVFMICFAPIKLVADNNIV